ncbi:MAG: hypothetical protein IH586_21580 [Anaerolineaceae bacterium]|nr:hypothetical protein [Anaerolineaceae bacterium]
MIRLVKYLKPYTAMILIAIILLFVQANCDLSLPDYMSRIVNNGIQQGGVDSAVPLAIRKSKIDKMALFVQEADMNRLLGNYILVNQASANYTQTVKEYPLVATKPVYVLNKISAEETSWLNPVMPRGLLAVSGIEEMMSDPAKAAAAMKNSGMPAAIDLSKLPDGTDIFTVLANLPAEQRQKLQEGMFMMMRMVFYAPIMGVGGIIRSVN